MDTTIPESPDSIASVLHHSGPLYIPLIAFLISLGIYQLLISIRSFEFARKSPQVSVHALLLASYPSIVILYALFMIPTTIPNIFVTGIDAENPLKSALSETSLLAMIGLCSFVVNLVCTLMAINRQTKHDKRVSSIATPRA